MVMTLNLKHVYTIDAVLKNISRHKQGWVIFVPSPFRISGKLDTP